MRFLTYLNSKIEKSEAKAAWFPYLPTIPMPTLLICIIPTSLPPSPIAATVLPEIFLMRSVIIAFCVGRHRQHITLGALLAISKNKAEWVARTIHYRCFYAKITEVCLAESKYRNFFTIWSSPRISKML
jgi:hypothetical protein